MTSSKRRKEERKGTSDEFKKTEKKKVEGKIGVGEGEKGCLSSQY